MRSSVMVGVALLRPEIVPAEADVVEIHRKAALFDQLREFLVAAGAKAVSVSTSVGIS